FTLIEILVVIVVIGVLSAFILVGMTSITNSANITKSKAFSESLRNSLLGSIISEWKFNGTGVADGGIVNSSYLQDSWSGNTLSTNGTVYVKSDCINNSCLNLNNGGTAYLHSSAATLNPGTGNFTIHGWVFATDYTYPRVRFSIGNYTSADNVPVWGIDDTYYSNGIGIIFADGINKARGNLICDNGYRPIDTKNKWTHMTIIFNRSDGKAYAYINGVKQSNSFDISTVTGDVKNNIMYIGIVAGWLIYGYVDEIILYNNIIQSSQIEENYYIGINKLYKNDGLNKIEYGQRLTEIKDNLAKQ
nr:prepilin-type N-terminal cleavage/methylation domain-containing protein [Candidatus Parcubacteria bacterium]